MNAECKATLDALMSRSLFTNIGKQSSTAVTILDNWEDAIESADRINWDNIRLEAQNRLTASLFQNHKSVLNTTWNENVDLIKAYIIDFITQQVEYAEIPLQLKKNLLTNVRYDFTGIGLEAEYSNYIKPELYNKLSYWYLQGHFPCGWEGEYPRGRVIIY